MYLQRALCFVSCYQDALELLPYSGMKPGTIQVAMQLGGDVNVKLQA